ncbi:membrane-bound metallopeptidase [Actinobacillus equuli]|nr:membrane-bound metallopeptidase [Actinobacillus equuli]
MGKVLDKLKETEMSLTETRQAIKRTEQEIQRLEKQEKEQKEKLKEQLDSAYRSGIHPSVLERLMSEQAKNADRMGLITNILIKCVSIRLMNYVVLKKNLKHAVMN